jgi:tetratricopeptide (TPR) repeat protein
MLERYAEAKDQIEKAVNLGSTSSVIHEHLGDIYYQLDDVDKAVASWQRALDLDAANEALAEKIRRRSL